MSDVISLRATMRAKNGGAVQVDERLQMFFDDEGNVRPSLLPPRRSGPC